MSIMSLHTCDARNRLFRETKPTMTPSSCLAFLFTMYRLVLPTQAVSSERAPVAGNAAAGPDKGHSSNDGDGAVARGRGSGSVGGVPVGKGGSGGGDLKGVPGDAAVEAGAVGRVGAEVDWGSLLDGSRVLELLYRLEVAFTTRVFALVDQDIQRGVHKIFFTCDPVLFAGLLFCYTFHGRYGSVQVWCRGVACITSLVAWVLFGVPRQEMITVEDEVIEYNTQV